MRAWYWLALLRSAEAGCLLSAELLEAMGRYNEGLRNAGVLLSGGGLKPSPQGKPGNLRRTKPH